MRWIKRLFRWFHRIKKNEPTDCMSEYQRASLELLINLCKFTSMSYRKFEEKSD